MLLRPALAGFTLRPALLAGALLFGSLFAPLGAAQQSEIIGSLVGRTTHLALAKGNCLRIDRTVILQDFAFYLELAEPQSLVFTIHRGVAESGSFELEQSWIVPALPAGPTWYSPTALYIPLLAGNHYVLSVAWSGTLTYAFHPEAAWPLSFGEQRYAFWSGAYPLPMQIDARNEMPATYLMSLETRAPSRFDPDMRLAGTGCSRSGLDVPRLTCVEMPLLGNRNFALEVGASEPGRPVWLWITPFPAPQPIALGGSCFLHLDPLGPWFSLGPVATRANAVARFPIAIPYDPTIAGLEVPFQAAALDLASSTLDLSNAIFLLYR
jgi:hypothetical protein